MSNPSLNGVSRIDTQIIGELELAGTDLTESEALLSAERIGMDGEDIERFKSKMAVGRFVSAGISGYVMGQTVQNGRIMDKCMAALEQQLINAKNPESVIRISDAIARLNSSMMTSTAVQLKAVEIMAQGRRKKNRQANAPQMISGTVINAENVQVNGNG